tara:strand:- start:6 stop:1061 length:1056 start_codon:yes stop_codon:yes gene_type:complete
MGGGNAPANNFGFGTSFDDPRTQGILGASMGLLNAGGWSKMPTTLGQGLAQGLSQGMSAYNSAMKNAPKNTSKLIQNGKFIATTAPDGTVSIAKSDIHDQLVERENADRAMKDRYQVVGGSLIDMKDLDNPNVIYDGNKSNLKTTYSSDGKYKFVTSPDGSSTAGKSSLFNFITEQEKAKKAEKKSENKLTGTLQNSEGDDIDAIVSLDNINKDANYYDGLIENKKLEFGVMDTAGDWYKGVTGNQGEEEINSSNFNTFIQKLANDSLKLAKGVQTEGDAQRVKKELLDAYDSNNSKVIQDKLRKIIQFNQRSMELRKKQISIRRDGQNVKPFDFKILENNSDIGYKVVPE